MYVFFDFPAPFGVPPGRVGKSPAHRWGVVAASLPALGGLLSAFAAAGDPFPPPFFFMAVLGAPGRRAARSPPVYMRAGVFFRSRGPLPVLLVC